MVSSVFNRVCTPIHRQKKRQHSVIPWSIPCNIVANNALVSQYIVGAMLVSLPNQLAYHTYVIQAAVLASAELYSQIGGKWAATRRDKSARKRVRQSVEEIYHCLGPIYFRQAY